MHLKTSDCFNPHNCTQNIYNAHMLCAFKFIDSVITDVLFVDSIGSDIVGRRLQLLLWSAPEREESRNTLQ